LNTCSTARFAFNTNSTTFLRGHGSVPFSFRNGTDAELIRIISSGAVGIQTSGYAIPNNHMAAGSLTIGNFDNANYGGGEKLDY